MQFDYFYGSQAEQFSFYRIPKVLFTEPQFMQHTGPWRSVHYLALGGTDYAALDAFLKYFPAVCKIVLCLDNDNAGRTRTQDIILMTVYLSAITPSCATVTSMAQLYNRDAAHSSALYVLSTLLSIMTMPLMIGLFDMLV